MTDAAKDVANLDVNISVGRTAGTIEFSPQAAALNATQELLGATITITISQANTKAPFTLPPDPVVCTNPALSSQLQASIAGNTLKVTTPTLEIATLTSEMDCAVVVSNTIPAGVLDQGTIDECVIRFPAEL